MRKKLFYFLLFFFLIEVGYSQTLSFEENQRNHRRYWYYRTRMINDFMKIGDGQGDCITFAQRNHDGRGSHSGWVGPDQIDLMNEYLAALALEYKLLSRNNQSTDETVKEIFYIIKMYNRLDAFADLFWEPSPPTNENFTGKSQSDYLNGFMLREDMPSYYLSNNITHYNYELLEAGYNGSPSSVPNPTITYGGFTGLPHLSSFAEDNKFQDYEGFSPPKIDVQQKQKLTCPMDKYYSMFMAFMLLEKYLPDGITYWENGVEQSFNILGEREIKKEIRNITYRCHTYLRGNTFGGSLSDWIIEYPNGEIGIGAPWRLGNPLLYSYPICKTVCEIEEGYNSMFGWDWHAPCLSKQDAISSTLGFVSYNALTYGSITGDDAAAFQLYNMATSNSAVVIPGVFLPVPASVAMEPISAARGMEWFELLRKVLHGGAFLRGKAVYANPLNSAPCNGPYWYSTADQPDYEWRSQDRNEHPHSRLTGGPPGYYPGVDYMLLHNLYYEYLNQRDDGMFTEPEAYKNAYNYMDNEDNSIWPKKLGSGFSGITYGVNNTDGTHQLGNVKVFQYLKSTAHVFATASPLAPINTVPSNVTYRAGKEIALQPGFQVEAGSTFHAYIKRYVCGVDDYTSGMRTAKDSANNNISNDYEGDAMNDIPLHYVEYPKSDADNYPYLPEELETSGTINQIDKNEVKITPNPSTGIFSVEAKKIIENEILSLRVYDLLGNLIIELNDVTEKTEINLKNYSKGVYMVHILSNLGNNSVKKVSVVE